MTDLKSDDSASTSPYQPYDYVACFEQAFESQFERIPFDSLDLRAEQPALRKLAEHLQAYFQTTAYPAAAPAEVVPHIVGNHQWSEGPGTDAIQFLYTPPIWYEEARKILLFSHKICFEDPLTQIIEPLANNINNRSYVRDNILYQPAGVDPSHIDLLRRILINAQKMARLIRAGLVIPHCLLHSRVPGFSEGEYSSVRFPDQGSYFVMEDLSNTLGALISEGHIDGFKLPAYLVERAKRIAPHPGDWRRIGWFGEFFDEIASHDETLDSGDPIREWPDHLYRIALYGRYMDAHKLGYSPHFLHSQGFLIYSVLEAADFATSKMNQGDPQIDALTYARILGRDSVLVSHLDAALTPRLDVLSDEDLISIRLEERLFEDWRNTVRDSLQAVQRYEATTSQCHAGAVISEVRDRFRKWQDDRARRLRESVLGSMFDISGDIAVGIIGGLAIGEPGSLASLAIGAVCTALKACGRTFAWRQKEGAVARHFLSVL